MAIRRVLRLFEVCLVLYMWITPRVNTLVCRIDKKIESTCRAMGGGSGDVTLRAAWGADVRGGVNGGANFARMTAWDERCDSKLLSAQCAGLPQ